MKLLVLSNNPNRASFRQRIGIYLDSLRKGGVNCKVAKLPTGSLKRRRLFTTTKDFDGVFLHKKCLNFFDAFWLRKYSKRIIYDFDDAIMYSPKAPQQNSLARLLPFRRTVKLADLVIVGNAYLAELARKFNPNVQVLPTALDISDYKLQADPKNDDKIRLVWIGSKATLRYLADIRPALEKIGSHFQNVTLRIVCDDFFELQNMKVEKCRWSKETEATDLVTSDIGLAPLPDNRFTRGKCGFKVLQYAAAGLSVVASPVGVNAEYVDDNKTGFHATSTSEWVNKITKLIENPQLRKEMGQQGQIQAKKFDVSIIEKQFIGLITKCLQQAHFVRSAPCQAKLQENQSPHL